MSDYNDRVGPVEPSGGSEPWLGASSGLPAPPSAPPPTDGSPGRGRWFAALAFLVAALLLVGTLIGFGSGSQTILRPSEPSIGGRIPSVTKAVGAVVDVNTSQQILGADGLRPLGAGSGVLLTADGEILTNNHVVEGASSIEVTIAGHGTMTAAVMGVDPSDDVALLRLSGVSGLSAAKIGDSSSVEVGDAVAAIGNAFGRGGTPDVTSGTVTGLHRTITANDPSGGSSERLSDVIQTDAEIHPGDSGGALVNADGQLVGIITAGPTGSGSGGGFAIPINAALGIVNQIESGHGSSAVLIGERGFLGVEARLIDAATAAQFGLNDTSGVLVRGVVPGSPADRAGMTAPAVIRTIDGRAIDSMDELGSAIHAKTPGERLRVTWVDQQGSHTATVTLVAGPAV